MKNLITLIVLLISVSASAQICTGIVNPNTLSKTNVDCNTFIDTYNNKTYTFASGTTWTETASVGGTMNSWTLAATSGAPFPMTNNAVAIFAGGYGLATSISSDTLTSTLDTTLLATRLFTHPRVTSLITLSGMPSNSVNYGTFTGTTIADNVTGKVAMQSLETAVETKATATTVTANRPAMWSGTGNELTAFPLESTLGLVRQTQVTAFELARGTTGEAPVATTAGRLRWNTTKVKPEISDGSVYRQLAYTNEYNLETFIINATATIVPIKNIFVYTDAIVSSETVTIDVTNLVGGTTLKVWAEGTLILDSSTGSFVASPGASSTATVTLTDQIVEYVWAFGSWFKTN